MPATTRFNDIVRIGVETVSATLISTIAVGSILLGGNVVTNSAENTAPSLVYDSGSYLTYQQARMTASGKYLRAEIAVSSAFASGSVIHAANVECNNTPVLGSGVLAIHNFANQSRTAGTIFKSDIKIGSGANTTSNTGSLIQTKIPSDGYVVLIATGGLTITDSTFSTGDCFFKLWTHEKYGR